MTPALQARLLGALESGTLMFLCGAGLSMAPPSSLPSAKAVANHCYDKWNPITSLDPALRDDIDGLATHFYNNGLFKTFIDSMVPWNDLTGYPNEGHAAIADFLITRSARGALSSNFDPLIEMWAGNHKVAMRGALDGHDAVAYVTDSNPLLKFHGCMTRDRGNTVWTAAQFTEPRVEQRRHTCSEWMNLNLAGSHLIVVGFWSDWDYLNHVFTSSFTAVGAASVTVVNPEPSAALEAKAPDLWTRLHAAGGIFEHVVESGDSFLTSLRIAYSEAWVRKILMQAEALLPAPTGFALAAAAPTLTLGDLYDLRRDLEGASYSHAGKRKEPDASAMQAAIFRLRLLESGGVMERSWIAHHGTSVRIVNGGGRSLSDMERDFREAPTIEKADVIVCAGAVRLGVPGAIISKGKPAGFVRPAAGSGSAWMTVDEAEVALGL